MDELSLQRGVRTMLAIAMLVLGVSHLLQPRAWARFFINLHKAGDAGNFANALITFVPGVVIVAFHQVWYGIPMVLTIIGWLYLLKATIYLLVPSVGLRSIARVQEERVGGFRIAGGMLIAVGGLLLVHDLMLTSGAAAESQ